MEIKDVIIQEINSSSLIGVKSLKIRNSIIKKVDFRACEVNIPIVIENCIIHEFQIHSCWFVEGLLLKNNQIHSYVDYQVGGHNEKTIEIVGNIFYEFFNFFDCIFMADLVVRNNSFIKGSNLIGNIGEGFANSFEKDIVVDNNLGSLEQDGIE